MPRIYFQGGGGGSVLVDMEVGILLNALCELGARGDGRYRGWRLCQRWALHTV